MISPLFPNIYGLGKLMHCHVFARNSDARSARMARARLTVGFALVMRSVRAYHWLSSRDKGQLEGVNLFAYVGIQPTSAERMHIEGAGSKAPNRKAEGIGRKMSDRRRTLWAGFCLAAAISMAIALPVEPDQYRLLSISKSAKMILISQIPTKTKYLLDATTAKITVDGKPAEFQSLQAYTIVRVKFESRKGSKDGIDIDGIATEIQITTPENRK